MVIACTDYPRRVVEDIARLRRRIEASGLPGKLTDRNLIVGTWNIRAFGEVFGAWEENAGSPKRNLRAMASIAEVASRFDVLAVQEVKRETTALRMLLEDFLGPDWGVFISDVTAGSAGNTERLAYIFDRRRVQPSGLAGELVLPPEGGMTDPARQFARTPYIAGFRAGGQRFALLTAHIDYGEVDADRLAELQALASYTAVEIRDRARTVEAEESNLIVLGDFNIDKRGDNPLFQAFISTGLFVPPQLWGLKSTFATDPKYYDQIAWFQGDLNLAFTGRAGVVDFVGAVFKEMTARSMSYRVSDHFPLWVEFAIDRSAEQMAPTVGADPAMPDPLSVVPD
jgi:endonuclease/exonuclease/phosphatase family metal-dependent hydrolase